VKFIFFVLISLNVVLFVWEYFGHERPGSMSDAALRRIEDPSIDRIVLVGESPAAKKSLGFVTNKGTPRKPDRPRSDQAPEIFGSVHQSLLVSIEQQSMSLVEDLLESELTRQFNRYQDGSPIDFRETPESGSTIPAGETSSGLAVSEKLCYKLGPRISAASFSRIARDIKQSGPAPSVKSESVSIETGFMVLHPAAESFDASRANLKKLNDKGLRDLWMINDGPLRGSVSLGFFHTRERAEIMLKELEAKQIEARVEAKLSKKTAYFLVFLWIPAAGDLHERLLESGFQTTELQVVEPGNCKPREAVRE
jgi:hypothetical protein